MCRPVNCKTCGKTTWAGCGQHVDQVMEGIPTRERCPGHATEVKSAADSASFFSKIFGRS
ncbi:hypothetical protein JNB_10734 [Janibacter sp. HTCC2649]|uniref:hypothetical protein n=1 Tax=Janibacter sp. HTCC2649 TaxID=313589 RepID=UPI0000670B38|nr:hypothetical protein [Janibacter sp. HTCC2649]EAQ00644.1 hypothetical protein JNB_10734 [Janibacter sp. HTCC2649]